MITRFFPSQSDGSFDFKQVLWLSQPGLINYGLHFRSTQEGDETLPVTIEVWNDRSTYVREHKKIIKSTCRAGRVLLLLDMSGTCTLLPSAFNQHGPLAFHGAIHKLMDDLVWLDDQAALRACDVTEVFDKVSNYSSVDANVGEPHVYGLNKHGIYAQLTTAVDSGFKETTIHEGIGSCVDRVESPFHDHHNAKSLILHGVLHHWDLPGQSSK